MKAPLFAAALLASSCFMTMTTPECKTVTATTTGQLESDVLGVWEDSINPTDHLTFAPGKVSSTASGTARTGTWSLSGADLTIAWDDGVTSRPEPIFADASKLGISRTDVQCTTSPPPPFCSAYRRVDCGNDTTAK